MKHVEAPSPESIAAAKQYQRAQRLAAGFDPDGRPYSLVCSWCGTILYRGHPDLPVSHGMCERCRAQALKPVF